MVGNNHGYLWSAETSFVMITRLLMIPKDNDTLNEIRFPIGNNSVSRETGFPYDTLISPIIRKSINAAQHPFYNKPAIGRRLFDQPGYHLHHNRFSKWPSSAFLCLSCLF